MTLYHMHGSLLNQIHCKVIMYFVIGSVLIVYVTANSEEIIQLKIQTTMCGSEYFYKRTQCYFINPTDDIPVLTDKVHLPDDCIFFIETSCTGGLNYRQACAIESAARAHPERLIIVLFLGPVARVCLKMSPLSDVIAYRNVKIFRIHVGDYLKNTPMEAFLASGVFHQSHYPIHHSSDILRFITLYKFGGIYLDLDVIVAKSFDGLPNSKNWVSKQSPDQLGSALIAFSRHGIGHKVVHEVLRRLNIDYHPDFWSYNSIGILYKVLLVTCSASNYSQLTQDNCQGIKVYEPYLFYPVPFDEALLYFAPQIGHVSNEPFAYHLWNFLTQNLTIFSDSLYNFLVETHCPKLSRLMH